MFEQAHKVANILGLDTSTIDGLNAMAEETTDMGKLLLAEGALWFQLGTIFNEANIFIANTPNRGRIPAEFGDDRSNISPPFDNSRNISQPFAFLLYSMMCFNGGVGLKGFRQPGGCCSDGNNMNHGEACIELGKSTYNEAKESVNFGHHIDEIVERGKRNPI